MANKKTVVQMYEEIMVIPGLTDEQKAFLAKRIEITQKKNASGKGGELTPKQKEKKAENDGYKTAVLGLMEQGTLYSTTDLLKLLNNPAVASTQKLAPLLTDMVEENRLVRSSSKGRSVYSLPSADTETADEG